MSFVSFVFFLYRPKIILSRSNRPAVARTAAIERATFSAPGTYWLRAQVNDSSGNGGGGDQCCWTSARIRVTVK